MTVRDKIEAALRAHGPMTVEQLRKHVKEEYLAAVCSSIFKRGIIRKLGGGRGSTIYGLPGQSLQDAKPGAPKKGDALERGAELGRKDPDKTGKNSLKKGHGRKAARRPSSRNGAGAAAAAPAPAPHINGAGAHFAINEHGELGIDKGDTKVKLDADEFTRLRGFIERTQPVWKGARA